MKKKKTEKKLKLDDLKILKKIVTLNDNEVKNISGGNQIEYEIGHVLGANHNRY